MEPDEKYPCSIKVELQKSKFFGSRDNLRTGLVCLFLILATLTLYWPARHYDFVQYDDNEYVFDNPVVRSGLTVQGLVWTFVDAHASNWHPLTWISHMLDCELFGLDAGAHHLSSVLLHSVNATLLFLLLRSMTGTFWSAAFVAALFAWHPLRVESVAWVSERKDLLSGFFFILTLWAYCGYVKGKDSHTPQLIKSALYYWMALGFFVLGLLAKPMLVTLPLILFLVDWWPLKRFSSLRDVRLLWKEKIPFLMVAVIVSGITCFAQKGAMGAAGTQGLVERVQYSLASYLLYLEKLFWPHDLSVLYLRPSTISIFLVVLAAGVLAVVSLAAIAMRRNNPYFAAGWFWFVITLLPVIGLVPIGLQIIADRYTYLPCIGLFLAITWGAAKLTLPLKASVRSLVLGMLTAVILSACWTASRRQLAYWQNTETLLTRALQIEPNNYIAHVNLGVYYSKQGKTEAAQFHRQRFQESTPK